MTFVLAEAVKNIKTVTENKKNKKSFGTSKTFFCFFPMGRKKSIGTGQRESYAD